MADSDFWRELAEKFRAIEDRLDFLHAEWKRFGDKEWALVDDALAAQPHRASIAARFEPLARRGGAKLDSSRESLSVWLHAMKLEGRWTDREVYSNLNDSGQAVEPPVLIACWIMRICKSSAHYCNLLESRALETERIAAEEERRKNDPAHWPEIVQQYELFKSIKSVITGPHEEIPEEVLRNLIAQQDGIKPEDVTLDRLRLEANNLFRHYPAITVIPSTEEAVSPQVDSPDVITEGANARDPVAVERCAALRTFKDKARAKGIKVTDAMVAKAAKNTWNERTMIAWWKRNDPQCKPLHDKLIRVVLTKDPGLLWPGP